MDINPNSCEITKLRLWIELLKYSYYLFDESGANTNALETLPNIDINIKCGNSLISRFSLDDKLNKIKNIKKKIQEYKELVASYKNPDPLHPKDKTQLENKILELKVLFSLTLKDPKTKSELEKAIKTHIELYNDFALDDESLLEGLNIGAKNLFGTPELSPKEEEEAFASYGKIRALRKKLDSALSGEEYKNAFEWRFEFPEVLDEEGNFLGFDAIIGNPPYISAPSQEENPQLSIQRKTLASNKRFKSLASKWDLYIPFIELGISFLCKENAICSMIVPYSLTNQIYGKKLREMLTSNFNLYELTDLRGTKVFESATVINCIVFAKKQSPLNVLAISKIDENQKISKHFEKTYSELIQDEKNQVWNTTQEKRNLSHCADFNIFGDFCYISYGLRPNSDEKKAKGKFKKEDLISDTQDKIHCKPYIEAKDFEKYRIKRIRYLEYGTERCPAQIARPTFEELYQHPKLMFNVMGDLCGTFNDKQIFHNHSIIACVLWKDLLGVENRSIKDSIKRYSRFDRQTMEKLSQNMKLKYILGILNSKYAQKLLANLRGDDYHIYPEHIRNLPIPQITESNQSTADKIIALVERILEQKEQDPSSSTQELEKEIDSLVYTLYNLTNEEIKIIENKG